MSNIQLMKERAPVGEKWSDNLLKGELSLCGGTSGKAAVYATFAGIIGYPLIINRYLRNYFGYETRILLVGFCMLTTTFGTAYFVKIKCQEGIKKLYAEEREKELGSLKGMLEKAIVDKST